MRAPQRTVNLKSFYVNRAAAFQRLGVGPCGPSVQKSECLGFFAKGCVCLWDTGVHILGELCLY